VRSLQHLIQLQILHLQFLRDGSDLLFKDEVLQSFSLLNRVDRVVEYIEEGLPLFLFVFVGLHLDLILVLEIAIVLLLLINFTLDLRLLLDDRLLLKQILVVTRNLNFELLQRLDQLLPFLLDLAKQTLVLILLLMQFLDLVLELLDEIEVGRSDFRVVSLDVRIFLGVLSSQLLYLVVLLVLQLFD
jgi:hypothetical protein